MKILVLDGEAALVLGIAGLLGLGAGFLRWWTEGTRRADARRLIVIGGLASIGAMYIARPIDLIALVAGSLIAGWAGEAVLAALEARARLQIAKQSEAEAKQQLALTSSKLDRAEADIDLAISALQTPLSPSGLEMAGAPASASSVLTSLIEHRDARRAGR